MPTPGQKGSQGTTALPRGTDDMYNEGRLETGVPKEDSELASPVQPATPVQGAIMQVDACLCTWAGSNYTAVPGMCKLECSTATFTLLVRMHLTQHTLKIKTSKYIELQRSASRV